MHIYLVHFIVYQALHLQSCRNHLKLRMVSFPPRGIHWLPPGAWEHRRLRVPSAPFQGLARILALLGSLEELVCMWFLPAPRAQPFGARSLGRGVLPRTCCQSLQPQEQSWAPSLPGWTWPPPWASPQPTSCLPSLHCLLRSLSGGVFHIWSCYYHSCQEGGQSHAIFPHQSHPRNV